MPLNRSELTDSTLTRAPASAVPEEVLTSPETEWVQLGKLDETADRLGLGAIVVMPDGDDGFYIDSPTPIDYDACLRDGAGLFDPNADRDATCVKHRAYETHMVKRARCSDVWIARVDGAGLRRIQRRARSSIGCSRCAGADALQARARSALSSPTSQSRRVAGSRTPSTSARR